MGLASAFRRHRFRFWTDISASRLETKLSTLREDRSVKGTVRRGLSAQTSNFYPQAAQQFCRWMVRDGRAIESPLTHLQGMNVRTDRRHDRRALAVDELRWLLDQTTVAAARFAMTGRERAMLYRLAAETGLRASELRSLTRASFDLDGKEPTVTIAAAYAKNRRQDTLPLKLATAAVLKEHLHGKTPAAVAFRLPPRTDVSRMFRADLDHARNRWLDSAGGAETRKEREASSFLARRDASGRAADIHALRHTFITNLVAGGVHPKTAQSLARHGTIGLAMDRYTHVYRGDLAAATAVLPDL